MTRKYAAVFLIAIFFFVPSVSSAKSLTQVQINSIIQLLLAFNVDSVTIAKVEKSLGGTQQGGVVAMTPTPALTPSVPAQTYPFQTPNPQPAPVVSTPASSGPVASEISVQSSVCNLAGTNLKTDYPLGALLQNGNIDGRIWMDAYVLNQYKQNYYDSNPSQTMMITTSDHSNDQTLNGSPATGPCGFHYGYQFYATKIGAYTITYSIPSLNLSKTVTITVSGPEKPTIGSSGITVSTSQQETDYPLSERSNVANNSNIIYWFQSSKPGSQYAYMSAQCSDADTPLTKVDLVSSFAKDGLYYLRGRFFRGDKFSGATTCKFINSSDSYATISTESDPVVLQVE